MTAFTKNILNYENIILDMDGNILDNIPHHLQRKPFAFSYRVQPIARPHLKQFMKYVFDTFKRVSIWTAGTNSWYKECYDEVLRDCIPEGKKFDFVMTREDFMFYYPIKPLSYVYMIFPDYNSKNTIIVDDNPITYSKNVENAIGMISFTYSLLSEIQRQYLDNSDFELLKLMVVLDRKMKGEIIHHNILISDNLYKYQEELPVETIIIYENEDNEDNEDNEYAYEYDKENLELQSQIHYDNITDDYGDLYD
jgi:hypothetical protein